MIFSLYSSHTRFIDFVRALIYPRMNEYECAVHAASVLPTQSQRANIYEEE